ncbi:LamG domain-containing protein [Deltaproteobacteria bacterium]|nr:LamG domain-containing protein [Deltaproteobacteria bacterium]
MPGQVDGNTLEILTLPTTLGRVEAQVTEVLWGVTGTIPAQEAAVHQQVLEVLAIPGSQGMMDAQVIEALWLDLSFEAQVDTQAIEVLWGVTGVANPDESAIYGQVVELLTLPNTVGQVLASTMEFLVRYDTAVAAVSDISGPSVTPATFDGTTSIGLIAQYQWQWLSVPVGSLLANAPVPYPDAGGTTPIDMTSNTLLYHAEEVAGTSGFDTSGSVNTANLTAITVGVPGHVGSYAWNYTGITSKAQPAVDVPVGTSWTIAYWFLGLAPNTEWRVGVSRASGHHHIIVEDNGDRLGVYLSGAFRPTDTGFTMPVASYAGWHHLVAVGTAGGNTRFYIDGVFVGAVVGYRSADAFRCIGNHQTSSNQRFADRIDEFALWTRELSDSEIRDIYILQDGNHAAVGSLFTFTPDEDGIYTVNLTVVDGIDGNLTSDTADAVIGGGGILFPLQGDQIRMWGHLQGQGLRRLNEK